MNVTVVLYSGIFILTTFFAKKSQYIDSTGEMKFIPKWLVIAFAIHWFFLAFTNIGADYYNYIRIINEVTLGNVFQNGEIVFYLLCLILKSIFQSPDIVMFLLKTISLLLFYQGFSLLKKDIGLWLCVLAFNAFLYLPGFFIIAMQLAIALLFLSAIFLSQNRTSKSVVLLVLACLIHASCILFVPIYVLYWIVKNKGERISTIGISAVSILYLLAYFLWEPILFFLLDSIPLLSQYKIYSVITDYSGLKIMQFVFFIPLFYYAFFLYRNSANVQMINLTWLFTLTAFLYAMLGYKVAVFSRINKSFFMIYAFFIPYFFSERKQGMAINPENADRKYLFNYRLDLIIWVLYLVLRGVDNFLDMGLVSSSSGLNPYCFFWPFNM